jgi:preprotein translocase subunit SecA
MIARFDFKKQIATRGRAEAFAELVKKYEASCKIEHDEVVEMGGLHIIGTERHESRRIDNQLRGRAGRQGDPGYSKFYLSLEDDLMRIFAATASRTDGSHGHARRRADRASAGHAQHRERAAQGRRAQLRHRKNLLEYDDVMNAQRKTVYSLRQQLCSDATHPKRWTRPAS